jgi:hypothetical protein
VLRFNIIVELCCSVYNISDVITPDTTTTSASLFSANAQARLYAGYNQQKACRGKGFPDREAMGRRCVFGRRPHCGIEVP